MVEGNLPPVKMEKNHFLGIVEQGKFILDAFDCHKKIAQGDLSNIHFSITLRRKNTWKNFLKSSLKQQISICEQLTTNLLLILSIFFGTENQLITKKTCKIIERFRKVVGLAQKLDWLKIDPFRNYHIKFKRVEMGFLEPDEQKCWDIRHLRLLKFIRGSLIQKYRKKWIR